MRAEVLLTVTASNGAATLVDLYENESISYSSNFNSVSEFTTRGAFSREFRIPATDNNVAFFGQQYSPSLLNNDTTQINVLRKIDATLSVNTLPIAEGHIQFKQAVTHQGKIHEFVISFFGETVDLARSIGDKLISELDYTDLAHENSYENVNDINAGTLFSGAICYTLTDKGQNWSEDTTVTSRRIFSSVNPIYTGELTLAVQAKWLLNKIITEAGFTYSGTTLDEELVRMYIPYITNPLTIGNIAADEAKFSAEYTADHAVTIDVQGNSGYYYKQLTGWTETLDPSNSFASDVYTAQGNFNTTFNVNLEIDVDLTGFSNDTWHEYDINLRVTRGGLDFIVPIPNAQSVGPTQLEWIAGSNLYNIVQNNPFTVNASIDLPLEVGDEIRVFIYAHAGASQSVTINADSTIGVTFVTGELQAQPINISSNAPEQKQVDFLRDILKMFNAVLVPDANMPNAVEIIPMVEYLGSGADYDWTGKLDLSKDITLTPASDVRKRLLKWSYKEQGDVFNAKYKSGAQRVYG